MFSSHPKANKPRFCNYKDQGLGRCWKILTSPGDTEVPKAEWENQDQCKITNPNRFNSYATCSSLYLPSSYTRAPNAVFTALPCLQHQPGSALHALFWRTIPPKPSQQLDYCCLLTSQLIAGWSWLVKTTAGHGKFKAGQTDRQPCFRARWWAPACMDLLSCTPSISERTHGAPLRCRILHNLWSVPPAEML